MIGVLAVVDLLSTFLPALYRGIPDFAICSLQVLRFIFVLLCLDHVIPLVLDRILAQFTITAEELTVSLNVLYTVVDLIAHIPKAFVVEVNVPKLVPIQL